MLKISGVLFWHPIAFLNKINYKVVVVLFEMGDNCVLKTCLREQNCSLTGIVNIYVKSIHKILWIT